ncbi:MAG TPA: ion transporter [Cyclobacteriaceae bacterium]|nr:ion transporter [Cyclobacteriaceae bacterium]HRJ81573.1 ion transporter [Cyclobacteriaceae bacterium]
MEEKYRLTGLKLKIYEVIFESDTPEGKYFDIVLLVSIILSVTVVMLESVQAIKIGWGNWLVGLEWFFTGLFTLEYLARIWVVLNKRKYIFSFFGIVDLLSVLPTYLTIFFAGAQSLLVIRSLRLLRIFRIFKLARFIGESQNLTTALKASRYKIIVFLTTVITAVIIFGTLIFLIEGPENGFTSIPLSIYWAIVTMTTVGYGDIAPHTTLGQTLASIIMIMGYGIIAVPTGIVSSEMIKLKTKEKITTQVCPHCLKEGHDSDAIYCKYCGGEIN